MKSRKNHLVLNILFPGLGSGVLKSRSRVWQLLLSSCAYVTLLIIYINWAKLSSIWKIYLLLLAWFIYSIGLVGALYTSAKVLEPNKDLFFSFVAFVLCLGFWVPLFNIGFAIVSIYLGLKAIRLSQQAPKIYGGRVFAVVALVISVSALVLTLLGVVLFYLNQTICAI